MLTHFRIVGLHRSLALVLPAALLACSAAGPKGERILSTSEAVTGDGGAEAGATITISGTVTDPIDGPQAGIIITLAGSAQGSSARGRTAS